MNNIQIIWDRYRTPISFFIMALILILVAIKQSIIVALGIFNMCIISAIMALGVNIQWGYAGIFNIGIMGFAAIGGLSVIIISQPPIMEAVEAGGMGLLISLALIVLTVVISLFLYKRKYNKFIIFLVIVFGYILTRHFLKDSVAIIEAINPATTGYIGGLGLPVLFSWFFAALIAAAIAWCIGKITLGLRSDYLAIATLGISEIIIYFIKNENWLSRGVKNVTGLPRPVPYELVIQKSKWLKELSLMLDISVNKLSVIIVKMCYAGIFIALLTALIIMANLALNSPWGRKVRAIRDNELSASAMGKNVSKQHLQIFIIGSAIVALAGAMLVTYNGILSPNAYQPLRFTFLIWVMVIVGGSGNNLGSIIGAFVVWFLWIQSGPIGLWFADIIINIIGDNNQISMIIEARVQHLRLVFMGVIMLLVMRFTPGGILPEKRNQL